MSDEDLDRESFPVFFEIQDSKFCRIKICEANQLLRLLYDSYWYLVSERNTWSYNRKCLDAYQKKAIQFGTDADSLIRERVLYSIRGLTESSKEEVRVARSREICRATLLYLDSHIDSGFSVFEGVTVKDVIGCDIMVYARQMLGGRQRSAARELYLVFSFGLDQTPSDAKQLANKFAKQEGGRGETIIFVIQTEILKMKVFKYLIRALDNDGRSEEREVFCNGLYIPTHLRDSMKVGFKEFDLIRHLKIFSALHYYVRHFATKQLHSVLPGAKTMK
jgi:hypothetical protein